MTVDELAQLLEAVPCHKKLQIAIQWNGQSYTAPLACMAKPAKAASLYLLPHAVWQPLKLDVWKPEFFVKP